MNIYIITVKLPKNPEHDPRNKQTDICQFSPVCSDSTGEHHSFLGTQETLVWLGKQSVHITRAEFIARENVERVLRDANRTPEEAQADRETAEYLREKYRTAGWPVAPHVEGM